MKKSLLALLLLCAGWAHAQKKSVIGFSVNATDFDTPYKLAHNSLKDVLKDGFFGKMQPGFSIMYWQALNNHLDFSARYNGVFSNNGFTSSKADLKDYYNELEGAFHLRAFKDHVAVNPFLSAGAGIGNYWSKTGVAGYAPLGLGVQFNLMQETYLFLQGNYRWSFNTSQLPSSMFYSFGITQSLHGPGKKQELKQVPLPIQENKDRDNDGVENDVDGCPDVAGTVNGCPDTDKDGVADKDDRCPQVSGVQKYSGCPIPDTDNDGINDEEDKCKDVAGLPRYNGCPIPDRDNDGVNDEEDKCPDVAGIQANSGCPEIKKEVIEKVNKSAQSIYFMTGKDVIEKRSNKGLDNLVSILQADPTLNLTVEGHTDNTGRETTNQVLSEKRALAIKNYLVKKGIDEERITTAGFGSGQPVADNKTAAGRAKNRRVEMSLRNY
jgi:OOP family OmpA-OmpF porin